MIVTFAVKDRVAKRTANPGFLANKVASKFKGDKADEIRILLMKEENWYIIP